MLLGGNPGALLSAPTAPVRVQVGLDAAVSANHRVAVRSVDAAGAATTTRFVVAPTLAGLESLSRRLGAHPGVVTVADPTSMTWLPLGWSRARRWKAVPAGLAARRATAGAISGKNKSDAIDADVLARAGEVSDLRPPELVVHHSAGLHSAACPRRPRS